MQLKRDNTAKQWSLDGDVLCVCWWMDLFVQCCSLLSLRSDNKKRVLCTFCLHSVAVTLNVLDMPGECGRCTRVGQKTLWCLHWETSWPDCRLSGARHLRWILWLERLPNTNRYCTAQPQWRHAKWKVYGPDTLLVWHYDKTSDVCLEMTGEVTRGNR